MSPSKNRFKRGGSYIDSPEWLKNKNATINPENNDDNCFQYALTVALNLKQIKSHPKRISKVKPFIDQYNWKEIDFPPRLTGWKKFEQNNKRIALNTLFLPQNTHRLAYKSKHNFKRESQVILLVITDGKKWHYLTATSLPALLKGIAPNHKGDFYCLNCFHSYRTGKKLKKHERVYNDHDYYYVEMPDEGKKILKVPAITYTDLKCLLEKTHSAHVKITMKNFIQRKNTEAKIAWKGFVRT